MRPCFRTLIFALSLAVLSAQNSSAQQPVSPAPEVELQDVFVVGSDVGVTFTWSTDGAPPPAGAVFDLFDSQGFNAGSASFVPVYGPQTVWLTGAAIPSVTDNGTWPLSRQITMTAISSNEILLENAVALNLSGPAQIFPPIWPFPYWVGRQCYLHVASLTCNDPEDNGGDEPYLDIEGLGYWRNPYNGVRGVTTMQIGKAYLTCDTCVNFSKNTKLKLYDADDPGFPVFDPDDHLGTENVNGCTAVPTKSVKFSGSNYTYYLKYRVSCVWEEC